MADNQAELLIQLVEKLQENGVAGLDFSSSLSAFYSVDESEREQLVDDYIKGELEAPKADSSDPAYENIVLAHDLLERLSAAGINYDNPLYAQHISDYWNADDKKTFINKLQIKNNNPPTSSNDNEQVVGENESGNPVDDAWKEEIRTSFQSAADKHKQLYEEIPNQENPKNLQFNFYNNDANRDAKKVDGTATFHDRNHVSLDSKDYNHFLAIIENAKNAGITTITFGDSVKTPEYKKNLYLACLKLGMEIKNPPSAEEIQKINPKLETVIENVTEAQTIKTEMQETRKEYNAALEILNKSPEYQEYLSAQSAYTKHPLYEEYKEYKKLSKELLAKARVEPDAKKQDYLFSHLNDTNERSIEISHNSELTPLKIAFEEKEKAYKNSPAYAAFSPVEAKYMAAKKKAVDILIGDDNSAESIARLQRLSNISNRDLNDRSANLGRREGESDSDFAARKLAIKEGRWIDTLRRKENESDADYQTRKENITKNWKKDPNKRVADNSTNERRELHQRVLKQSLSGR